MLEYPRDRPKVFAVKVTRQLMKMCAGAQIGALGFALINAIVATEDRAGYRRSVTFYDIQLMMILGVKKQHELAAARSKAVKAGWLQYSHGSKGRPGEYFVTIPESANLDDDGASDEGDIDIVNESQTNPEQKQNESQTQPERIANESQTNLQPFFPMPSPVPSPSPRKVFVPPTVEQVRDYCNERSNSVDPERFVDFYQSKGWLVGKTKMKDWKAAVRTWEQDSGKKPGLLDTLKEFGMRGEQ